MSHYLPFVIEGKDNIFYFDKEYLITKISEYLESLEKSNSLGISKYSKIFKYPSRISIYLSLFPFYDTNPEGVDYFCLFIKYNHQNVSENIVLSLQNENGERINKENLLERFKYTNKETFFISLLQIRSLYQQKILLNYNKNTNIFVPDKKTNVIKIIDSNIEEETAREKAIETTNSKENTEELGTENTDEKPPVDSIKVENSDLEEVKKTELDETPSLIRKIKDNNNNKNENRFYLNLDEELRRANKEELRQADTEGSVIVPVVGTKNCKNGNCTISGGKKNQKKSKKNKKRKRKTKKVRFSK
jgi:hypothetical protein